MMKMDSAVVEEVIQVEVEEVKLVEDMEKSFAITATR